MLDSLLAIIAPHSCCGCGNLGSLLCEFCKNDIIFEPPVTCLLCEKPTADDNLCLSCKDSGLIEGAWFCGIREGTLERLLNHYKFDSAIHAGFLTAELLNARLPLLPPDISIAPVPTAPTRVRVRGFDHTRRIAKRLATLRNLSISQPLRKLNADVQHFKSRSERLTHASTNIEVKDNAPPTVLLIDDIYTTGATVHACVRKLREAGAKTIYVAIIARQTLD